MTTQPTFTAQQLQALAAQLACPHDDMATTVSADMAENNAKMITETLAQLPLVAGDALLEIGHGGAAHLPHLFARQPEIYYYGLEISEAMHQQALTVLSQPSQAQFYLYDGTHFPTFPTTFNHIFTVNTLYFWRQPAIFLRQLGELLAPNGRIVITYGTKDFMETLPFTRYGFTLYAEDDINTLATQANLTVISHHYQRENIKSRIGTLVERHYCVTTLQNKNK